MARGHFSNDYAKDDILMDELAGYFEMDSANMNMVLDYDSLVEYFKKYMDFSDISPEIIDAIGVRVLDTVNKNRKERGMKPLSALRSVTELPPVTRRIKVRNYFKRGKQVKGYKKSAPRRWTPAENNFIKTRKALPLKELAIRFNERFPDRTKNSIMTQRSRLKKI